MCRVYRIDTLNLNTSSGAQAVSRPIVDDARGKIYFAWASSLHASFSLQHNHQVFFRAFDIATETFDALPVAVSIANPDIGLGIGTCDSVSMLRLASTGELIVFYGDIIDTYFHTSTDNGVNWSSPRGLVTSPALSFQQLLCANDNLATGDLYCWTQQSSGGAGINDVYLWKRPGGSAVWTGKGLFDDGDATTGISVGSRESAPRTAAFKEDGQTGFAVFPRFNSTTGNVELRSYYTTNDWASKSVTVIKSWAGITPPNPAVGQMQPILVRGRVNTNRWWMLWVEVGEAVVGTKAWIAHTDDWGVTWTIDGTPSQFAPYQWDEAWDRALMVDYADNLYASVFTVDPNSTDPTYLFHTFFRHSGYADTGWTKFDCKLTNTVYESGATSGDIVYSINGSVSKAFRIFNYAYTTLPDGTPNGGDGCTTYNLLVDDDIVPTPHGGPTCIVSPLSDYIILPDGTVTLCGPTAPEGVTYTWAWTGPGGFTASTQCITVSVAGTYTLTVTDELGQTAVCQGIAISVPAPETTTAAGTSIPHHRGPLPVEPSGHPSGLPSTRRIGHDG